jgi:hypothetical protein
MRTIDRNKFDIEAIAGNMHIDLELKLRIPEYRGVLGNEPARRPMERLI